MLSRIYQASDARMAPARQRARITAPVRGVPVYVMLPLDTVWLLERDGATQPLLIREKAMEVGLEMLSRAGVDGVMIDVWWGIAEHAGPGRYDFSAYRKLFEQVASKGLKVQAVMSFHAGAARGRSCGCGVGLGRGAARPPASRVWLAVVVVAAASSHALRGRPPAVLLALLRAAAAACSCHRPAAGCRARPHIHRPFLSRPRAAAAAGNNVGDCCRISLPRWVLEAGEADPDIFFTDSSGYRNRECLSIGADEQPVLAGRTPIQAQVRVAAAWGSSAVRLACRCASSSAEGGMAAGGLCSSVAGVAVAVATACNRHACPAGARALQPAGQPWLPHSRCPSRCTICCRLTSSLRLPTSLATCWAA